MYMLARDMYMSSGRPSGTLAVGIRDVHIHRWLSLRAGAVPRFNTGVANHQFCRHCGIHAFYVPRSDPDKIDVNVRCLDGVDVDGLRPRRFDGKNWEQAKANRDR